jgi:hypothetical protein
LRRRFCPDGVDHQGAYLLDDVPPEGLLEVVVWVEVREHDANIHCRCCPFRLNSRCKKQSTSVILPLKLVQTARHELEHELEFVGSGGCRSCQARANS